MRAIARGIVTYSSGNHAQAVAIASKHVGAQATIVMPEDAPKAKLESTRAQGAKIVTYNRRTETRETIAREDSAGDRRQRSCRHSTIR